MMSIHKHQHTSRICLLSGLAGSVYHVSQPHTLSDECAVQVRLLTPISTSAQPHGHTLHFLSTISSSWALICSSSRFSATAVSRCSIA